MTSLILYKNLLDFTSDQTSRSWILVDGTHIVAQGQADSWSTHIDSETLNKAQIQEADDKVLAPAFVDIHCHGGGGISFEDAPHVEAALDLHGQAGTGTLLASLVSNPLTDMGSTMATLLPLLGQETPGRATLAGFHAEGPFISPLHKGAHNPATLRAPSADQVESLWEAAEGKLLQITLAPEADQGLATIRRCIELGIRVAVGHTDATYEQAKAAFDEGASLLTHTFNAMRPLHHRQPGPVAAAADSSHVTLELICDGVHVHEPMVRAAFALAPGRVALITDAMAAAGCSDGAYKLGSLAVEVQDSIARIAGTDTIAGSTLTLAAAIKQAVAFGIPLRQALEAASSVPARALGLDVSTKSYTLLKADGSLLTPLSR
ncbi:N-acetylglucosamine-6-phosphate deacetylase [Rothia nasimurium]|uniref:N-acetylglucosamine-6-phosphate deacetylase n=1 Tax=Rothia nasimurium TaxID=85336 RepID=UPI002DD68265|nr:N-acetylglucosamine-6-phosphate deacetylase [Rothia nasimurium]